MTPRHQQKFSAAPYQTRRQALIQRMLSLGGGVALIPTSLEKNRNGDAFYDFRPDSTFLYLTGFSEPEAVLLLIANEGSQKSILFCREKNIDREIWDGYRFGPEAAQSHFGVDLALPMSDLAVNLPNFLSGQSAIFVPLLSENVLDASLKSALKAVAGVRNGSSVPSVLRDIYTLTDEMRLIKDETELGWLRDAGAISAAGHVRAMQACRVGMIEADLEAEILYSFARSGAQHVAYSTIVAAGANACVLHYRAGKTMLNNGDLCLIDAGAEYGYYAGDITRTFPVNGKFTDVQRSVYEVVLAAQKAAIEATRAGVDCMVPHYASVRVLTEGLLGLGILDKQIVGSLDDAINSRAYQAFYMHKTSHWIGLDAHDCGAYSLGQNAEQQPVWRDLKTNMMLTIEPGLYIRPNPMVDKRYWNLGVRIEDNVIVMATGCEITTRKVPVTIDEIEYLMKYQHED